MHSGLELKAKLARGHCLIGAWMTTNSPDMAEILALGGLDFLLIDQEHGQSGIGDLIQLMRAMKGHGASPIVRVPRNDAVAIKQALDTGPAGIMIPSIQDRAEAEAALAACRYPPAGRRGAFGAMRASSYGFREDYPERAADELFVVLQIESAAAVREIAAIGGLAGIDVLFIGPRDLSASIGKLNRFADPAVQALVADAERRILQTGCALGSTAAGGAVAASMRAQGYRFLIPGSDVGFLRAGLQATLKALHD